PLKSISGVRSPVGDIRKIFPKVESPPCSDVPKRFPSSPSTKTEDGANCVENACIKVNAPDVESLKIVPPYLGPPERARPYRLPSAPTVTVSGPRPSEVTEKVRILATAPSGATRRT